MKKERFVLKKEIKLDENLAWLVGFYLAEGSKTRDYIGVSNNELCLINKSLRLFKKVLGIDKTSWTIWIKTNKRRHKEKEILRKKWSQKIKQEVRISYGKFAFNENIEIRINSRKLSSFLNNILKKYPKKILQDRELTLNFLKGYIIGDGGITLRQKQIHYVGITVKELEYRNYLIKALELLYHKTPNIRMTKKSYELYYCHVSIITKIIIDGLFDDLDRQRNKLIKGYENKQYTRARIKYWAQIYKKSLNPNKIAELSGNSHWSVRDALNLDIKRGLVRSQYKLMDKKGYRYKFYSLSKKGRKLFNIIKGVK